MDDKDDTPTLRPGKLCTCSPTRRVRFVLLPVPGLRVGPTGEVNCRDDEGTGYESIRQHAIPAGVAYERHVPRLDRADRPVHPLVKTVVS